MFKFYFKSILDSKRYKTHKFPGAAELGGGGGGGGGAGGDDAAVRNRSGLPAYRATDRPTERLERRRDAAGCYRFQNEQTGR